MIERRNSRSLTSPVNQENLLSQDFIETVPVAIGRVDTKGVIQFANRSLRQLCGDAISASSKWMDFVAENDVASIERDWNRFVREEADFDCDLSIQVDGETDRRMRIKAARVPEHSEDSQSYSIVLTDLDRTVNGSELSFIDAENQLLESFAGELPLSTALKRLIEFVQSRSHDLIVSILVYDKHEHTLRHAAADNLSDEFLRAVDRVPIEEGFGSCGTAAARMQSVWVADVRSDPLWEVGRELARQENIRACWSTPIVDPHGILLGTFAIYRRTPGHPSTRHLQLIETATHLASMLLSRYRDEQNLKQSRDRLRLTQFSVDSCNVAVFWLHSDSSFFYVNDAAVELFGYARDELLKMSVVDIDPNYGPDVWPDFWKRISEVQSLTFESAIRKKDGSFMPVEIRANHFSFVEREFVFAFVTDITERTEMQESLRVNAERLDLALAINHQGIHDWDLRSNQLFFDRRFYTMAGYQPNEFPASYNEWAKRVHPADFRDAADAVRHFLSGKISSYDEEFRFRRHDGTWMWVRARVRVVARDETGRPLRVIGTYSDITEGKETETALRESEGLFRNLVETAPFGIQRNDLSGRITFANESLARIYGTTVDELVGRSVLDLMIDDETRQAKRSQLQRLSRVDADEPRQFEARNLTLDGRIIDVNIHWSYDLDESGKPVGFIVIVSDISERKKAENALKFQADVLSRVSDAVMVTSRRTGIGYANEAARRLCGVSGMRDNDQQLLLLHNRLLAAAGFNETSYEQIGNHGQWQGECELQLDNQPCFFDIKLKRFPSGRSQEPLLLSVVRDISSRRIAEQESRQHREMLAHVARLSTMGELVAGIAHEVKQPLYAINNFSTAASVALRQLTDQGPLSRERLDALQECNDGIKHASDRANEIIRRLREFSRKGERQHESVDLNQVVRDSVGLVSFKARELSIEVTFSLAESLPPIIADRIQCEQVVVNLLNNAFEAVADAGRNGTVAIHTTCDLERIELQVSDNGPGLNHQDWGRLFDAFYTTKQNGLGMGLAISRTIVEDHAGRLWASANQDGGATFHVSFPVARKSALSSWSSTR